MPADGNTASAAKSIIGYLNPCWHRMLKLPESDAEIDGPENDCLPSVDCPLSGYSLR
jgi:hypothetical protein